MEASQLIKGMVYKYKLKDKIVEVYYLYETLNYRVFAGTKKDQLYRISEPCVTHFITECK